MGNKLMISYRGKGRGEDGYRYTSVRLRDETVEAIDQLAAQSNRSRNEIIALMLEYGIENSVIIMNKERDPNASNDPKL